MTQEEKAKYMRIALNIQGIGLTEVALLKVINTYEKILEKKGEVNIRDIVEINLEAEREKFDLEFKPIKNYGKEGYKPKKGDYPTD